MDSVCVVSQQPFSPRFQNQTSGRWIEILRSCQKKNQELMSCCLCVCVVFVVVVVVVVVVYV